MPVHRLRVRRGRDAEGPHPPARAGCRSPRPSPTRSRSPARSAPRTTAASSTATSSPRTSCIDEEGTAKVTDFGIARSLTEEGLTADGRVLGTTDYVSPEQALGHAVGRPDRPLLARHRPLRDAHRRRAVPRREPGRRGDEARPRGAARRPDAPARGLQRAGRRRRPRDGARTSSAATDGAGWSPTSRTCWASRPRARARRPARRPRSCARCPGDARGACRCARAPARVAAAVVARCSPAMTARARPPASAAPSAAPGRRNFGKAPAPGPQAASRSGRAARRTSTRSAATASTPTEAKAVVDGDTDSTWSTESYDGGQLNGKPGVGIYVDAEPGVAAARDARSSRRRKGWQGGRLRRAGRARRRTALGDFTKVGVDHVRRRQRTRVDLAPRASATATTSCGSPKLPPGASAATIAEIRLFRRTG